MTKAIQKNVKCIKCGTESQQLIIYSVNFSLGSMSDNEKLTKHMQKCPKCGYEAIDISLNKENQNKK